MKLATSQAETSGNLVFKRKFDMQVSEAGRAIIIKAIIDMYSQPYVAVLREYSSNALDSHVWAGQSRPVELTLPSKLQPNLVVQDWGIGLSADELVDYAQFGESTKRDTNDQIGGFGLGSKSGLAVCSRFTVESVKDGKRSVVVIGRDTGGPSGGILVEDEDTDLPNGLKVIIPTTEAYRFQEALNRNFFLGWAPGTLLVNGEAPALSVHDTSKFEKMGEVGWLNIDTAPDHWSTHDYSQGQALVGPVSYRIDWRQMSGIPSNAQGGILKEVVVKLDNGSVDLTPSRENLIYSARTRTHILDRVNAILAEGKKKYQERVENAPTLRDAMILMIRAQDFGFDGAYTYKGKPIAFGVVPDEAMNATYTLGIATRGGSTGLSSSRQQWTGRQMLNNLHFLTTHALGKDKSVLVYGTEEPVKRGRRGLEHALAGYNTTFARALAERDSENPWNYTVTYTDRPLSDFPEIFQAAFAETMSAEDCKALSGDFRKRTRAAANQGRTATPKHDQDVVRMVSNYRAGGSYTQDVKIADLDATKTFIVLKNGEEGLVDKVRRVMMFQVGKEEYGSYLHTIIEKVAKDGEFVFLLANKNWKTETYSTYLPNMTTFAEAAQKVYGKVVNSLTPIQRLAGSTRINNSWATFLRRNDWDSITNVETREYVEAVNDPTIAVRLKFIEEAARSGHAGLKLEAKFTGEVPVRDMSRYPMLEHVSMYNTNARKTVVDYINLIDTLASGQGN